jgi:hypothetical protein
MAVIGSSQPLESVLAMVTHHAEYMPPRTHARRHTHSSKRSSGATLSVSLGSCDASWPPRGVRALQRPSCGCYWPATGRRRV